MFRLRRALVLLAAGAFLAGLVACGGSGTEAPSVPATKPKEPAAPNRKPLATANYSHGLKWWKAVQQPAGKTRIRVVRAPGTPSDPRKPRGRVMQAKLKPGDVTVTGDYSAARAEVYGRIATRQTDPHNWPDGEGSTRWYGFDLYVPRNFCTATDSKWMTITQWKGLNGGSPPVALEVRRRNLVLNNRQVGHPNLGVLTPGRWTRVVIGMHLTPDPKTGWIAALRDGRRIVQRLKGPTMDTYYKGGTQVVDPVYLKQGIYRAAAWRCSQTLYFGPITIGDSLGAVQR